MSTNRETMRDALVTLLTANLVGAGLPVKTVVGSKVEDLAGLTPLVQVLSAGTLRESAPINRATFFLVVTIFVRQATTGWTNAEAEDTLDEIESLIAGVYEDARRTGTWEMVSYQTASSVWESAEPGGKAYYLERIPTAITLLES